MTGIKEVEVKMIDSRKNFNITELVWEKAAPFDNENNFILFRAGKKMI